MRYPATGKREIIRQVEQSHLSAKQALDILGIPRTTFYRWYDRYLSPGEAGLGASGCDSATVAHRPRLLSDNGSSYISGELADWMARQDMDHVRGAPRHPQTQGKIERWHQTLKNRVLLENYYLPGALEEAVASFIEHYNHRRYHESLANLTPADVYLARAETILQRRKEIKTRTIENRRLLHRKNAA